MEDDHHLRREAALGSSSPDDSPVSYDAAFRLLAHHRRRLILYELVDNRTGLTTIDGLTKAIDNFERISREKTSASETLDEIKADLTNNHLPLFAEEEVISIDSRSGVLLYCGDPILDRWAILVKAEDLDGY